MSDDARLPSDAFEEVEAKPCPHCSGTLPPNAVVCMNCGYHLRLGRQLRTVVQRERVEPPDDNPYASPAVADADPPDQAKGPLVFDLTEDGAKRARAIVADSQLVYFAMFLASCGCAPAWLVILPWYTYRLFWWHRLNRTFAELRSPNSFSQYGELAVKFQDAHAKLWIGFVAGAIFWGLAGLALVIEFLEANAASPRHGTGW